MRQYVLAAADIWGRFVAFSRPSHGAVSSGLTRDDVLGSRFWDFVDDESSERIQAAFSRCLIHREPQTYYTRSVLGDQVEHWEITLLPAHGAEVVAMGREIGEPIAVDIAEDAAGLVRMLADDLTVEQIGESIGVPAGTIGAKLKRLRDKLGIRTNHGLVAWCLRFGVI